MMARRIKLTDTFKRKTNEHIEVASLDFFKSSQIYVRAIRLRRFCVVFD